MGYLSMSFFSHTLVQIKKNLFISLVVGHFFIFICFCFSIFPFFVLFSCLQTFFFLVLFFECCLFTVGPFLCISFFFENSVWFEHRFSLLFKILSFYILSLLHKKAMFFFFFWIVPFVQSLFSRKKLFLVCWSSKESNVPLWFLFLLVFLLSKKTCKISCFYLFLNLLFWTMSFFCLIFLDLHRNMFPWQLFFFTSLFPPFVHPRSICSLSFWSPLVFSFLSPFSPFYFKLFGLFIIFMFLYVKHCAKKKIFWYCSKTLFFCLLFPIEKQRFLCFFFFFVEPFFTLIYVPFFFVFFCVLKNGFSFCFTFFLFFFLTLILFITPFFMCPRIKNVVAFLEKRWKIRFPVSDLLV